MKSTSGRVVWALGVVGLLLAPSVALAQIPDEFMNLQVLPKDIKKPELVATMRGMAGDLGVRCAHCHVGPDNLQGMDFASDDKVAKRAAREMLKLTQQITQTVEKLPGREPEPGPAITCYNCHRGMADPPRDILLVLEQTAESAGADAALARYKSLRDEQYGKGRYDFSPRSLNSFAQAMLEKKRPEDARKALELNRQYFPDSSAVEAAFGWMYLRTGEKDKARAAFKHALELDPQEAMARFGLQQLDAPPRP
jgi:hypothetical protein